MHQCQYLDSNECGGGVKPQPRRASGIQSFKLAYLHYNVNRTVHKLLQGCAPTFGPFPRRYYCRRRRSDTVCLRRVRVAGSLLLLSRRHTVVRGRAERMSSSVRLEAKVDIYWDAENSDHLILRDRATESEKWNPSSPDHENSNRVSTRGSSLILNLKARHPVPPIRQG